MTVADNTEYNITSNVVAAFDGCDDPRMREVVQSLVRHLHAFVRDVEPSVEEWLAAIGFLTATGRLCDDKRQEFILLSDTLGISMLVDAINHRNRAGGTESTVLGPFYRTGADELPLGANIAKNGSGEPVVVRGRVLADDGGAIAGALLDVWQTNERGLYDVQDAARADMNLRGRFRTDGEGRFYFVAVKPVSYPIPDDGPVGRMLHATGRHPFRPAHIHFIVSAPGYRPVTTHLFVRGDPYLASDAVFGTKDSLVVDFVRNDSPSDVAQYRVAAPFYTVDYDFRLNRAAS